MTDTTTLHAAAWSPVRARRARWSGWLLVAGGVTLAAAEIVHPRGGDEVFAVSLAGSRVAWTAWGLLIMVSALLQLPAVVAFRGEVTDGAGTRLTGVGGAVLSVSLVALFAFSQFHAQAAAMVGEAPVPPELLAAFDRTESAPSLVVTAVIALVGFHLGWPLLLAGLARAGRVPVPLAIVGAAAVFLSFFGAALGPVGETALFVVAAGCLVAVGWWRVRDAPRDRRYPRERGRTSPDS